MGSKARKRAAHRNSAPRVYESAKPEEMPDPITFTLDGYEYICRELGPLELSHMARMHGRPADDPESVAFMAELFNTLLGDGQFREFRIRCGQFQTQPDIFVRIIEGIFEDFTNRPTGRQSGSSDGLPTTGHESTDDSSSKALEILDGRPDLQMAVLHAQEDRTKRTQPKNRLSRD